MKRFVPVILCLVLTTPSVAGEVWVWSKRDLAQIAKLEKSAKKRGGRHVVETEGWLVETDVSRRFTAELALFMDKFAASFDVLIKGLHVGKKVSRKPTVIVFDDKNVYAEKFPGGSRGYYRYHFNSEEFDELHLYSYIDNDKERDFKFFYHRILIHEGTHLLLRTYIGKPVIPKWFDEGIATYFQFWNLAASPKKNMKSRYSRSHFRDVLKKECQKTPPSLRELLTITTWNPDDMGPIANRNYAMAENFVDMLLSSREGQRVFKRTFRRLIARKELFAQKELAMLELAWQRHLKKTTGLK